MLQQYGDKQYTLVEMLRIANFLLQKTDSVLQLSGSAPPLNFPRSSQEGEVLQVTTNLQHFIPSGGRGEAILLQMKRILLQVEGS